MAKKVLFQDNSHSYKNPTGHLYLSVKPIEISTSQNSILEFHQLRAYKQDSASRSASYPIRSDIADTHLSSRLDSVKREIDTVLAPLHLRIDAMISVALRVDGIVREMEKMTKDSLEIALGRN